MPGEYQRLPTVPAGRNLSLGLGVAMIVALVRPAARASFLVQAEAAILVLVHTVVRISSRAQFAGIADVRVANLTI